MIRTFHVLALLTLMSLCMFTACDNLSTKTDNYQSYQQTLSEVMETNDPLLCIGLPTSGEFIYDEYPYNTSFKDFQSLCLWEYFRKTYDEEACELIVDEYSIVSCYMEIAKLKSDASYCDKMDLNNDEKGLKTRCVAQASRSVELCNNLKPLERKAECIDDVVSLTGDYEACLQIDGVEYGESWHVLRNHCLLHATELLPKNGQEYREACMHMVENYGRRDLKNQCEDKVISL